MTEAQRRNGVEFDAVQANRRLDFLIDNQGSVVLLHPLTVAAQDWVVNHIPEGATFFQEAVIIEHRYANDIVFGIHNDGLVVGR